jgi:hypothetical protein
MLQKKGALFQRAFFYFRSILQTASIPSENNILTFAEANPGNQNSGRDCDYFN